jgi:thiamine-monophosphate kinase
MTELKLVEWLQRQRGTKGIGDDCYIYSDLVFTTDMMVEGVHFERTDEPEAVGYKTLARGLSDIASMGADPRFCLLSLAVPAWADDAWLKRFYRGLLKFGVPLTGGDLSHADQLVCDIMVCGQVPKGKALRRDGAKPGDAIYVSGELGANARDHFKRTPQPKLTLGRKLVGKATACMDISDGLSLDLHRLCLASGVAAELETIPVASGATLDQALNAGEDYELLFTAKTPLRLAGITKIGTIQKGKPGVVKWNGKQVKPAGYDHFK